MADYVDNYHMPCLEGLFAALEEGMYIGESIKTRADLPGQAVEGASRRR